MSADLHVNSKAWLAGDPKHSFQAWQRRVPRRGKATGMSYDVIEYHDTNSSLKITEVGCIITYTCTGTLPQKADVDFSLSNKNYFLEDH